MRTILAIVFSLALAGMASAETGPEADYLLHCSGCHRLDGTGTPGVVPSLHGLGPLLDVEGGRSYLASVPGVAQAPLSDARLAVLLNWALATFSAVPDPAYTAAEVGNFRKIPLRDTRAARARLEPSEDEPTR